MLDKVLATIKKYNMIEKGDKIVIGVSGGADSVCLTDILNKVKKEIEIEIILVHINHNIRGEEAKRDENFVIELGKKYNNLVKVFSYDVEKLAKEKSLTVEEMGRKLRYEAFNSVALEKGKIAVAHNLNDNCETMIMRFFRGTGIKGLGGIAAKRENIIRPLIELSREEIERYCLENNLDYCEDSTNSVEKYTRNKIRLNLIPMIKKEFNKNIVNTMARCSEIMREEEEFLNKEAKKFYEKCEVEKNRIDIEKLKEIDRVLQRRIIRIGFLEFTPDLYDISYEHTESVLALIEKESGKVIELPKGLRAKREHNCIYFYKEEEKNSFNYKIDVDKMYSFDEIGVGILLSREKNLENCKKSYTIDIDCDKINSDIVLRSRKAGDKINLLAGSKSVKRLFIDEKIPASKRDSIPLLAVDSNVIWIKDLKTSSYFMANENSRNILYLHLWEV